MVKNLELKELVAIEITNLERLSGEMNDLLIESEREKGFIEVRAAGSILHDFYCGIEKIFERIALSLDKEFPDGGNWHVELLLQMGKPEEDVRDKIISENLTAKLKEFLRFRHLYRNIYGFDLKWDRIKPLCAELGNVLENLKKELDGFFV